MAARLGNGDFDEAARVAESIDDADDLVSRVGDERRAASGITSRAAVRDSIELLRSHVSRHPDDLVATRRLALHLTSCLEFDDAAEYARRLPTAEVAVLVEWTRATAAGNHAEAHRLKRDHAMDVADRRPSRCAPMSEFVQRIQAILYSQGPEAARHDLARRWPWLATPHEHRVRAKLGADLDLRLGDVDPVRRFAATRPTATPSAVDRFSDLIHEQRILVLGPAPTCQPSQAEFDRYDTIVTTGLELARTRRPRIVYLSNEVLARSLDAARSQIDDGEVDLLVLRPSMLGRFPDAILGGCAVRVQSFEDSTTFLGTHFAIQRIVYDLLAHGARDVTIGGTDFYLGETTHIAGYDEDLAGRFGNTAFNSAHDFTAGHEYLAGLRRHGLISALDAVEPHLEMPTKTYSERLGRVFW